MRRHQRVGRVAALHAEKPVLVLRALVGRILGAAHAGTRGPQELLVKLIGVERDGKEAAVPGAGAGQGRPAPLTAVGRPTQLELAAVLHEEVAQEGGGHGGVLHPVGRVVGGRHCQAEPSGHQPRDGQANKHVRCNRLASAM